MRTLHRPATDDQTASGGTHLVSPPFAIGFTGNHHHIGIFETLVAAIGYGQPRKQIHFCFLASFALLDSRNIIGLPVKAGRQIGESQFHGHSAR